VCRENRSLLKNPNNFLIWPYREQFERQCGRQITWKFTILKKGGHALEMGLPFPAMAAFEAIQKGRHTVKSLLILLLLLTAGCTAHPYTVCRGEDYCTPALSHEEAIRASEIRKTWQDEKLYVRPVKNREGT
jgi:hypothetical protein